MNKADEVEQLSLAIDEFLSNMKPRPKLIEACTAMLAIVTFKLEYHRAVSENFNEVIIEPLTKVTTILLSTLIAEETRETN